MVKTFEERMEEVYRRQFPRYVHPHNRDKWHPQRKPDPVKHCDYCGKRLKRKRRPFSGQLEWYNDFLRRRFCDMVCKAKWQVGRSFRGDCPTGPC
jgi:hypothetical protein